MSPQLAGKTGGLEMDNLNVVMVLFIGGVIGHLILRCSSNIASLLLTGHWHSYMTLPSGFLSNNKGEAATGEEVKFDEKQQAAVDKIVQARIAREREKYGDYEDLRKFRDEHTKATEQQKQKELEAQKNYEEAKKSLEGKINEFGQKLNAKDQEIQNLKIDFTLTNEISKVGGFVEESVALLKNNVTVGQNGEIVYKTKDANGIDVTMPLTDGVKKFYEQRPHLLKSTHKQGSGSGAGGTGTGSGEGTGSGQAEDLNSLNAQLIDATRGTDLKKISEIKQKIKAAMSAKGVKR